MLKNKDKFLVLSLVFYVTISIAFSIPGVEPPIPQYQQSSNCYANFFLCQI